MGLRGTSRRPQILPDRDSLSRDVTISTHLRKRPPAGAPSTRTIQRMSPESTDVPHPALRLLDE